MDKQEVQKIIREELQNLIKSDRYVFERHLQLLDGRNIQTGRTTGTTIATDTDQKIGFYGVDATEQQATIASPIGGTTIDAEARTAIDDLINRLQTLGLIA